MPPSESTAAPVVLCAGFHRSATSATAQWLFSCGLPMGARLVRAHESNPDGHFECVDAVAMHDRFLAEAGSDWRYHDEVDLPAPLATEAALRAYVAARDESDRGPWGLKDPRTCLFLPHWHHVLGARGRYLVIVRHWAAVIQSLLHRHSRALVDHPSAAARRLQSARVHLSFWVQPDLAPRMWLAYCRRVRDFVRAHPQQCLVVPHALLLRGMSLHDVLNERWGLGLAAPPAPVVRPAWLHEDVDEAVRGLVAPRHEAHMRALWEDLLELVDPPLLRLLDDPSRSPPWVSRPPHPLSAIVLGAIIRRWGVHEAEASASASSCSPLPAIQTRDQCLNALSASPPGDPGVLGRVLAWIDACAPDDAELLHKVALRALEASQFAMAELALQRAIAAGNAAPMWWYQLALVHEAAGRPARAAHYCREASRRNPGQPIFKVGLARNLLSAGRREEGLRALDDARPVGASPPAAWAEWAGLMAELGQADEALRHLDALGPDGPQHSPRLQRVRASLALRGNADAGRNLVDKHAREALDQVDMLGLVFSLLEVIPSRAHALDLSSRVLNRLGELYPQAELVERLAIESASRSAVGVVDGSRPAVYEGAA